MIFENRIALTTEDLVKKTYEVYNKTYTKKQVLESYINPLINQGYIDKVESELDHRATIYYPLINTIKNRIYSIRGNRIIYHKKPKSLLYVLQCFQTNSM